MPFAATGMELETLIQSEVIRKRKTNTTYITYMWNLNMAQMNLSTKQKQIHRHREYAHGCQGGRSGMDGVFVVHRCKLLYLEWMSDEVLQYSTGNYTQSLGIDHNGR